MVDAAERQKQWLIRKPKRESDQWVEGREHFTVLGPYYTDQVRRMIHEEILEPDDEICPENGYWFSLYESDEVKKYLGIDSVRSRSEHDAESTQPDVPAVSGEVLEQVQAHDPEATTAIMRTPKKSEARPKAKTPPAAAPRAEDFASRFPRISVAKSLGYYDKRSSPQILGVEKARAWSALFVVLSVLALAGVLWVIGSLRI